METIKNYLDNMFAGLPKTVRVTDLKNNILANMEDKYNEVKNQGKSENEAIGIVISEFGNIDELVNELGIRKEEGGASLPIVNREEVEEYIQIKQKIGVQIGLGVFLCILAPAALILISYIFGNGMLSAGSVEDPAGILGIIVLFIFVAIAVSIFIFSGMNLERYKYMEDGVQLPSSMEAELRQRYEKQTPAFYVNLVVGVCMIILSPVSIFISYLINETASDIGVVILLVIVAVSVYLFISAGTKREPYARLLQIGEYNNKQKEENKVIGAVAAIVWPLAVVIFLISGLMFDLWDTCWIVFPVTGILFGMFSAAYNIIKGNKVA